MDKNRKRQRERSVGGKYLLSGLVLCGVCGSAYCSRRCNDKLTYYRCIGTDRYRRKGDTICDNSSIKGEALESLVWSEVSKLLRDPERLRAEFERRCAEPNSTNSQLTELEKNVSEVRGRLDRLIDGYESGLLERAEFEKRIGPLRERHERERSALDSLRGKTSNAFSLESATAALSSLSQSISGGLDAADWSLKRDLLKLLVDRVEIHREEVRLVFKVPPNPFSPGPDNRGTLQHWLWRHNPGRCRQAPDFECASAGGERYGNQWRLSSSSRNQCNLYRSALTLAPTIGPSLGPALRLRLGQADECWKPTYSPPAYRQPESGA